MNVISHSNHKKNDEYSDTKQNQHSLDNNAISNPGSIGSITKPQILSEEKVFQTCCR